MTLTETEPEFALDATGIPQLGAVWERSHADGSSNGHQTIVDVRHLGRGRYAVLTVLDRGAMRYQTWTCTRHGRNADIRSYGYFDRALADHMGRS